MVFESPNHSKPPVKVPSGSPRAKKSSKKHPPKEWSDSSSVHMTLFLSVMRFLNALSVRSGPGVVEIRIDRIGWSRTPRS